MIHKPYPKDNEPRTMALRPDLIAELRERISDQGLGPDDLLFATRDGTPISRNTFRSRVWTPAVTASGIDFQRHRAARRAAGGGGVSLVG